jgi:hypothetical protein
MVELAVTWERIAGVWWLVLWRIGVGYVVIALLVFGAAYAGSKMGMDLRTAAIAGELLGYILTGTWALAVARMALTKKYRDFRIALVNDTTPAAESF